MSRPFTVCALFYGDYPGLASRLLSSLPTGNHHPAYELRIGMNNVSDVTRRLIQSYSDDLPIRMLVEGDPPYLKYPLMRHLFYQMPIQTEYVMWFDDDSWITDPGGDFFDYIADAMSDADMIGALYTQRILGNQWQFVEDCPWFTGRPKPKDGKFSFITGGWWTIRTEILEKWNWPMSELMHNGGDTLLGELCRQQGYRTKRFVRGVAINANDSGVCSSADRRGAHQKPAGYYYKRGVHPKPGTQLSAGCASLYRSEKGAETSKPPQQSQQSGWMDILAGSGT